MNKKQLTVAWVVGVLISFSFIIAPYLGLIDEYLHSASFGRVYMYYFQTITPILVIGGLLIYTLRNKK